MNALWTERQIQIKSISNHDQDKCALWCQQHKPYPSALTQWFWLQTGNGYLRDHLPAQFDHAGLVHSGYLWLNNVSCWDLRSMPSPQQHMPSERRSPQRARWLPLSCCLEELWSPGPGQRGERLPSLHSLSLVCHACHLLSFIDFYCNFFVWLLWTAIILGSWAAYKFNKVLLLLTSQCTFCHWLHTSENLSVNQWYLHMSSYLHARNIQEDKSNSSHQYSYCSNGYRPLPQNLCTHSHL